MYWCGGMRAAWNAAAKTDPCYYLLLNDDTIIEDFALGDLLEIADSPASCCIAVGAVADPLTKAQTYGGIRRDALFPLQAQGVPIECHTMHGNCVLVPRDVYKRVGALAGYYTHAMGDMDYGNAARRKGCKVVQARRVVGHCTTNPTTGSWRDSTLSRWERLKRLNSKKELPLKEWIVYCYRNCSGFWVRQVISPYLRILLKR